MDKELAKARRAYESDPSDKTRRQHYFLARERAGYLHFAVISGVGGNLEALEAVLADVAARGIPKLYCLGDGIGFGADPEACLDRLLSRCDGYVQGLWEFELTHPELLSLYHRPFQDALDWNRARLDPGAGADSTARARWQSILALEKRVELGSHWLCWGWPRAQPSGFRPDHDGLQQLLELKKDGLGGLLFTGSHHTPLLLSEQQRLVFPWDHQGRIQWQRGETALVNVGWVGQNAVNASLTVMSYAPCYLEFREPELRWHLVDYEASKARAKALDKYEHGEYDARRLATGLTENLFGPTWPDDDP